MGRLSKNPCPYLINSNDPSFVRKITYSDAHTALAVSQYVKE